MKKYKVNFNDRGGYRIDVIYAWSTNEAAQRIKERYGNHVVTETITEVKE